MQMINGTLEIEQEQSGFLNTPLGSLCPANNQNDPEMNALPHICFVAPHAWPVLSGNRDIAFVGGAEVQQCYLARGLAARGYRVSMLCLDYGQPVLAEIDGIHVHRLFKPNDGIPVVRFLYPRLTSLWRGMHKAGADIYYQRGADMHTGVVAAYCRAHGKKSIFAGANDNDFSCGQQLIRYRRDKWLFEYGLSRASAIVAQNPVQKQRCWENYGRDAMHVHSCYPTPAAQADSNGCILWVATVRELKRPERFLALAKAMPEYQFTMIGGPRGEDAESQRYYESIRNQAEGMPNVQFIGFVHPTDVEPYFDRAKIFVNTSDTEGFPNTFLQAWARGMPTISLFDPGSLEDNEPVCSVARDINHMIEIVRLFNKDDSLWRETGERCRRHFARHHALTSVLKRYEVLIGNLLDNEL